MKKVVEISVAEVVKDHVQILECGGVVLKPGDKLLVLASIAERMVKQYRGKLVAGAASEVEKLGGGHYQLIGDKAASKPAPKKEKAVAQPEQPAAEEGQVSDRSMGDTDGAPKRKKKVGGRKKKTGGDD